MLSKAACAARWELSPQLLGSPSGSSEAALARGAEQSQGLRISWATPRTCSTHPGKGGGGGKCTSQG